MKIKHILQLAGAVGTPISLPAIPNWFSSAPTKIVAPRVNIVSTNAYDYMPTTTTTVPPTTTTAATVASSTTYPSVPTVVTQVAQYYSIPVCLALGMAWEESRWNANDVGDNNTSFGVYQLHVGGELGNIPVSLAYNPWINALISLGRVSNIYHGNPNQDLGSIAAQAQRPYNPVAYAHAVDVYTNDCERGLPTTQWN